jgi:hypothetical protein
MNTVPIAAKTILTALMRMVSERVMPALTRRSALCSGVRLGIESGQDRQKGTLIGLGRLAWQEIQKEKPTAPAMTVC